MMADHICFILLTLAFLAFVTFFSGQYMRKLTTHTDIDVIPLQNEDGLVDGKPV
jgi:hypothetical protein